MLYELEEKDEEEGVLEPGLYARLHTIPAQSVTVHKAICNGVRALGMQDVACSWMDLGHEHNGKVALARELRMRCLEVLEQSGGQTTAKSD